MSNVIQARSLTISHFKGRKELYVTGPLCETFRVERVHKQGSRYKYILHNRTAWIGTTMKIVFSIKEVRDLVLHHNR